MYKDHDEDGKPSENPLRPCDGREDLERELGTKTNKRENDSLVKKCGALRYPLIS